MFLFSCKFLNIFFLQDSVTILSQVCFILIKANGLEGGGAQNIGWSDSELLYLYYNINSDWSRQSHEKANKSFILLGMKYHSPSFPESLWVIFLFKRKNLLGEDYRNLLFNGMQKITTNVFTCLSENPVASNQLIWYSNTLMTEGYNKQV